MDKSIYHDLSNCIAYAMDSIWLDKNMSSLTHPAFPDFHSQDFLQQHIRDILAFYQPRVFDPNGGFFQNFRDDGCVFDADSRHLVSSTRFVFNYAMGQRYFNDLDYHDWIRHRLDYLETRHRQTQIGGYAWLLGAQGTMQDATNHCYGLAFVMIAGIEKGCATLNNAWNLMERYFWNDAYGLYADEASLDFSNVSVYRGRVPICTVARPCCRPTKRRERKNISNALPYWPTILPDARPPKPMAGSGNIITLNGKSTGTITETIRGTCSNPWFSTRTSHRVGKTAVNPRPFRSPGLALTSCPRIVRYGSINRLG